MTSKVLKTEKGSVIKRSYLGVGKDIGGVIYLHKTYVTAIPDQAGLTKAEAVLKENYPTFVYNVVKWEKKTGIFTFVHSPDFDSNPEPTAGQYIQVNGNNLKKGSSDLIWHHKWLWVKDDYRGFDVEESFERSKKWLALSGIEFSKIGKREFWEASVGAKLR